VWYKEPFLEAAVAFFVDNVGIRRAPAQKLELCSKAEYLRGPMYGPTRWLFGPRSGPPEFSRVYARKKM